MEFYGALPLIAAATVNYVSSSLFDLSVYHSGFSKNNFTRELHLKLRRLRLDNRSNIVDNHSFLFEFPMGKTCWPTFKSFKTKREGVLPLRQTITLIDHHFILCETVSCFVVGHTINTSTVSYVCWTKIFVFIIFRFNLGNLRRMLN